MGHSSSRSRRAAVLAPAALLAAAFIAACNDDGRTLRPPVPGRVGTVSTTSTSTTELPQFGDPSVGDPQFEDPFGGSELAELTVTAPWRDGAAIDARYTCDGSNVAPALTWSPAPAGTAEIAISLRDLDAPGFIHWEVAGIDPATITVAEGAIPFGAYQATNGGASIGYTGPCPPPGSTHTYAITVHYLGQQTELGDGADGRDLQLAIDSATIAFAEITGVYSRS